MKKDTRTQDAATVEAVAEEKTQEALDRERLASPDYAVKFWRTVSGKEGVPVMLASGVTVLMRQYPLHQMLLNQRLPKNLQAAALHVYNEGAGAIDMDDAINNIAFIDSVIVYCLVSPQVTDGKSPAPAGSISVHEIPISDRLRMFSWAMGGVRASKEIVPF